MIHIDSLLLEIRILDDGFEQVRRKDRKQLTDEDLKEARRLLDSLPGITVDDVLRVFPGARIVGCRQVSIVQTLRRKNN